MTEVWVIVLTSGASFILGMVTGAWKGGFFLGKYKTIIDTLPCVNDPQEYQKEKHEYTNAIKVLRMGVQTMADVIDTMQEEMPSITAHKVEIENLKDRVSRLEDTQNNKK